MTDKQTLTLNPDSPQDALIILRSIIFSANCTLNGEAFVAAIRSLDALAALVQTGKEGS